MILYAVLYVMYNLFKIPAHLLVNVITKIICISITNNNRKEKIKKKIKDDPAQL